MADEKTTATDIAAVPAKIDAAAAKAYAEAAAKQAAPAAAAKAETEAAPARKATARKAAAPAKAPRVKAGAAKTPTPASASAAVIEAAAPASAETTPPTPANPLVKLKDSIMETVQNTDLTTAAKDMVADVQTRVKTVYAKTGEFAAELGEFNKANVDAMVASGKIFVSGAQDMLRDNLETGKTVIETVTEDAKKMAAVKSPTELMQLQGELARRNFDAMISYSSKRTEAMVKLYNDAFAPISNRVSVATEKLTKAA